MLQLTNATTAKRLAGVHCSSPCKYDGIAATNDLPRDQVAHRFQRLVGWFPERASKLAGQGVL